MSQKKIKDASDYKWSTSDFTVSFGIIYDRKSGKVCRVTFGEPVGFTKDKPKIKLKWNKNGSLTIKTLKDLK